MPTTKKPSRTTSRSVGALLTFVALGMLVSTISGFAYFYWMKDAGLGMSLVIGFLLGSFFLLTIDVVSDAGGFVGKAMRKLRRR